MISFGARYVDKGSVSKYDNNTCKYKPVDVNIVELEKNNKADLETLRNSNNSWKGGRFTKYISKNFEDFSRDAKWQDNHRFYALTTQSDTFNKLDSDKILGYVEIAERNDGIELKNLQGKPENNFPKKSRQYKNVGKCVSDFLKKFKQTIEAISDYPAEGFYVKEGYELVDSELLLYRWKPKPLKLHA
jgi:hypothetical protein